MSIHPGSGPDPHHGAARDEAEGVPPEEGVDPAKVEEQLATEPEEARNATDGYAPAEDRSGAPEEDAALRDG